VISISRNLETLRRRSAVSIQRCNVGEDLTPTSSCQTCERLSTVAAEQDQTVRRRQSFAPKPEEVAANAAALASAPATLVAPPRTISDVTAILDEQKLDAVKVAGLTATVDAPVGPGLADFYYRRDKRAPCLAVATMRLPTPNLRSVTAREATMPMPGAATNSC
jgi:hypothetical protein